MSRTGFALASVALAASACSAPFSASETSGGFISGDGSVTLVDAADREPLEEISGETLEGEPLSTEQFDGNALVLNVWGEWCTECRLEAADLQAASTRLGEDVQFIGIDIRDQLTRARRFQDQKGITYPSIFDPDSSTLLEMPKDLYPISVPTTYVVDTQGRVAARILGPTTEATLSGLVEDVLAEDSA